MKTDREWLKGWDAVEDLTTGRAIAAFVLSNAAVAAFFYGFWIWGWKSAANDLVETMDKCAPISWIVSFFATTFFSLNIFAKIAIIRKPLRYALVSTISLGCALLFSLLFFVLLMISSPFFDPMF